ncbi:ArsR/SmtB family transcription factor [Anaerocolumna sp. MB42-C2]|uniref:ArsR/SmtB family transcription factor n=1 Tax=Anaerocolumna sp. MB42-C2 TaxID=3070997 RepID=UPI0027DF7C5F|nr:metalloregulator ArsR/SmtB family transcription factor [Anaerocolumna sp. MB42-C2]WMJ86062.1 metalloregulator ArsR/SmtB family transcription factor [Anaerocolumna sp. MB42-C2]
MNNIIMPHDHGQNIEKILKEMPEASRFLEAAVTFQQLCDGSRLRILWLLCHSEECVSNIAAAVNMSDAAVSHHLKTLRLNNLITSRRDGKEVYYTLSDNERARLVHRMIDDYFQLNCPTNPHL